MGGAVEVMPVRRDFKKKCVGSEGAYNASDAKGYHLHVGHHFEPVDFPPLLPACA